MKLLYVFKERAPMRRALSRLIIILICQTSRAYAVATTKSGV
jgi:hypothetical protein